MEEMTYFDTRYSVIWTTEYNVFDETEVTGTRLYLIFRVSSSKR